MRRLLDASIWIAFYRIGELDLLLRLPGLCITPRGLRELEHPRDDLAARVKHLLDKSIAEAEAGEAVKTLAWVLQQGQGRLSETDALEIAIATDASREVVLYMRDWPAEMAAALAGSAVRTYRQLVEEMEQEGLIRAEEREALITSLDEYYARSRQRRR
ncbi:MAG: hypothetical protein ACE5R4_12010 [Armatimonadota bacterium]